MHTGRCMCPYERSRSWRKIRRSWSSVPGPPGLTAAYELAKRDVPTTVLEGDAMVGGISRTVEREGWRFDIGGHRFFTKVPEVEALWHEILPDEDFLMRPRMSRIYYNGKFFDYPLKAVQRAAQPRHPRGDPVRAVLRLGAGPAAEGPDELRGLGRGPLRVAALPHLLQDLHREGVGRAGHRDPGRLGGAAHQEPVAAQGDHQRAPARGEPEGHHLAHRGVPVPEVRPRDDVGDLRPEGGGRRAAGSSSRRRSRRFLGAGRA